MLLARIAGVTATSLSFLVCLGQGQTGPSPERLNAIQTRMGNIKQQAISKLPPQLQKALSGGALNLLQLAKASRDLEESFARPDKAAKLGQIQAALQAKSHSPIRVVHSGPIPVSNPGDDFLLSIEGGFTQSETSTAWCGSGVVVGFNDSGSVFESLISGPGGLSFAGAGASTDAGDTFRDIGYVNPGSNPNNLLSGDPVVNCTDANSFYYSQIALGGTLDAPTSAIFLSKSTDGGFTWEDPIPAVSKDAFTHFLDKDWSVVDQKSPNNIFISYTDFDDSFEECGPNVERVAIETVHSADGGITWSAPTVMHEVCSVPPNFPFVQGSQIVVDSQGKVYVEWEYLPNGLFGEIRELRIARSTNHAASFEPSSKIDNVFATGDGFVLQGNFRTWLTGNLAVDRSGTKTDGDLYVTWEDGRFHSQPDVESPFGVYRSANVLISRSTDGGKSWCPPVRVNNDALESSVGFGIDHFQPGTAVDAKGTVGVCWYDRRDDPFNYRISRYCGVSKDHGTAWANVKVDPRTWPAIHATDALVNPYYLGDYDTVASDKTESLIGFQSAYGNVTLNAPVPNQDVFLIHLKK